MMVLASRTSILEEILDIDVEIERIRRNPTYRKIVKNLRRLRRMGIGNPVMTIPSPDDFSRNLKVRRHSKKIKEVLRRYDERRLEYEEKIEALNTRRKGLEKKLFD